MVPTPLVVDLADSLQLIRLGHEPVRHFAALILSNRKFLRDGHRRFTEERRIDRVVRREWCPQRDLASCIARGRRYGSPVACQHRRCGYEARRISRICPRPRSLVSAEEEEFVPKDGTAQCSSELVALQ